MYQEITSTSFSDFAFGYQVEFKYWIDEDLNWWYCYDDIVEFMEIKESLVEQVYKYKISDNDKCEVYDYNNYDNYGAQIMKLRRFVTKDVVRRLINRNNERNNKLMKVINNLEYRFESTEVNTDYIAERMEKLEKSLNKPYDYEEVVAQAYELVQIPTSQDILDKLGKIDKEKEELVDEFRDYIYDDYYDEIEINVHLSKRNDCESDEERELRYKKNKNIASTMPSWLKDVVK